MTILALDMGIKSLGIAISDKDELIAIPKENLIFEEGNLEVPYKKVMEYIKKFDIRLILLGYPLKTSGELASITSFIEEFELKLKKEIKIRRVDERFSTQRAKELLPKTKLEQFKSQKDVLAAWIILHDYLINT